MQVYTPKWKANAGAQLNLPWFANYGKLTFNTDFSWQSLQYDDQPNSPQLAVPAYGVLNARLSFATVKDWTVTLAGTNITDKFYWSIKNFVAGNNQWHGVPGRPAEWDLTIRKTF
jgi:iron complex outermembrane recepter protein